MGRQIGFFAIKNDIEAIVRYINSLGGIIIQKDGNELDKNVANDFSTLHSQLYLKTVDSKIKYNYYKDGSGVYIDCFNSEVVEFSPSFFQKAFSETGYDMQIGRFYMQTDTYNHCLNVKTLYNKIVNYIKKNYVISENKDAYMGKDAFALYKEGKLIPKSINYIFSFKQ